MSVEAIDLSVNFMRACELEGLPEPVRDAAANCILLWPQALPFLTHAGQEGARHQTYRTRKARPPSVAEAIALSGHVISDFSSFFGHLEELVRLAFENVDLLFPMAGDQSAFEGASPLGKALVNIFNIPGLDPQSRMVPWTPEQITSPNMVGEEALQISFEYEIAVCKFNVLGWIFGDLQTFAFYSAQGDFANLQVAANMLYELYRLQVPLLVLETFSHQMAIFADDPISLRLILPMLGQIAGDASVLFRGASHRLASHMKLFKQDIYISLLDDPDLEESFPLFRLLKTVREIPLKALIKPCLSPSLPNSSVASLFVKQLKSFYLSVNVEVSRLRIRYAQYAISGAREMSWSFTNQFRSTLNNARPPRI